MHRDLAKRTLHATASDFAVHATLHVVFQTFARAVGQIGDGLLHVRLTDHRRLARLGEVVGHHVVRCLSELVVCFACRCFVDVFLDIHHDLGTCIAHGLQATTHGLSLLTSHRHHLRCD